MEYDTLRKYMLSRPGALEDYPFNFETLVFKVLDKIFALIWLEEDPLQMNLKCDPDEAIILRQEYKSIKPGYHMNKKHWNTIVLDGTVPDEVIYEMVDNSYLLVVKGMKKADRERLGRMGNY